jgi:hypothetical protein
MDQDLDHLAKRLIRNQTHRTAWIWFLKTGLFPKAFEDYNEAVITTMLHHFPAAQREMAIMTREAAIRETWLTEQSGLVHDQWTKPRYTGDPVADAWEAAIARGEMPDL